MFQNISLNHIQTSVLSLFKKIRPHFRRASRIMDWTWIEKLSFSIDKQWPPIICHGACSKLVLPTMMATALASGMDYRGGDSQGNKSNEEQLVAWSCHWCVYSFFLFFSLWVKKLISSSLEGGGTQKLSEKLHESQWYIYSRRKAWICSFWVSVTIAWFFCFAQQLIWCVSNVLLQLLNLFA